jgi:hypothetical protein
MCEVELLLNAVLKVSKLDPGFEIFKTAVLQRSSFATVRDGVLHFYFQKSSFENKNATRLGTA